MASLRFLPFAQTVLKNLFSKPVTTAYPFAPAQYPQRMRGHVEIKIEDCISCGLCVRNCPPGALSVDRSAGTWTIQRFDCVQCGNCVNVCPKKCLTMAQGYTQPGPEKQSETFTRPVSSEKATSTGGKPVNDATKCVYCTLCAKKCPQQAIAVDRAAKTWTLNAQACVGCGICATVCPKKCLKLEN